METKRKAYEKPMLVFENFETGELTGSPELIARLLAVQEPEKAGQLPCPAPSVKTGKHQ